MPRKLTERQAAFARHVVKGHSATEAARKAGYSEKTADRQAKQLLEKTQVQEYLAKLRDKLETKDIADANEVLTFFTGVMRGEIREQVFVKHNDGTADVLDAPASLRERRQSAEDLAKYHSLFIDKSEITLRKDPRAMTLEELEAYLSDRGLLE